MRFIFAHGRSGEEFGRNNLVFRRNHLVGWSAWGWQRHKHAFRDGSCGITANPIVISDLFSSPRAQKIKVQGI